MSEVANNSEVEIKDLMVFNQDAIAVIEETPLFNEKDKKEIISASENMENSFFHSQVFRTDTEARISVLNDVKFPTPASKYYQSLREMNVHQCELVNLLYDYEDKKQDLKIIRAEIMDLEEQLGNSDRESEKIKLSAQIKKKEIELAKTSFSLKTMKRMADGRKQEIMQWDKILKELTPVLDELQIPKNDPDAHQKVSYAVRFIRQARNSFLSNVEMGTAEANNLLGQLTTNMKVIREEGLEETVARNLSIEEQQFIVQNRLVALDKLPEESRTLLVTMNNPKAQGQLSR